MICSEVSEALNYKHTIKYIIVYILFNGLKSKRNVNI